MNAQERLAQLRGGFPVKPLDARRVAGSLEMPGCGRRVILDAAGVPLDQLAQLILGPTLAATARQSPFALARGVQFERLVNDNGMAALIALTREHLGLEVPEVRQADLSMTALAPAHGKVDNELRVKLTRQHLRAMLRGDGEAVNLIRHPLLTLDVAGQIAYLEADAFAFAVEGHLYVAEVKSFASVDDQPDPEKVSETGRQTAVYLASLQDTVRDLGFDPAVVATRALLVVPKNFSLTPMGHVLELAVPLRRLRRQLAAMPEVAALLDGVAEDLALPTPVAPDSDEWSTASKMALDVVTALPPRFGDACIRCPMHRPCRAEARRTGAVAQSGSAVANLCGDVQTIGEVMELADGRRTPRSAAERALAGDLGRVVRVISRTEGS